MDAIPFIAQTKIKKDSQVVKQAGEKTAKFTTVFDRVNLLDEDTEDMTILLLLCNIVSCL